MVGLDGFGDLGAYGHDRIQGGHGFLEDHGYIAASVAAHGFGWEREKIFSCKRNVSCYLRGVWKEAMKGQRGGRFAGTGLTYKAKDFAGMDLERNIFDGWMGAEGDREIGNIQQWRGFHWFDSSEFVDKMW
jgi:hypothetical protein